VTTYSYKDQTYEPRKGIHTGRTDNHSEGPVPMTYPCPQLSSWLVQVLVITLSRVNADPIVLDSVVH
jgi:hypothetical protein